MEELVERIEKWVAPILKEEELFLVDVTVGANYKIQVFIDKIPRITIESCAKVSRFLEGFLDEDPSVPEKYTIDVSSPGMGNPLKVPMQYKKRVGSILVVQTMEGEELVVKVFEANESGFLGGLTSLPEKGKKGPKKPKEKPDEELEKVELNYTDIKQAKLHFNF